MYYCSLIYEPCLHKQACFFVSTTISQNCSASLEISLFYQVVYYYLLDNLVSEPSFVPTVIAALYPSNKMVQNRNCKHSNRPSGWYQRYISIITNPLTSLWKQPRICQDQCNPTFTLDLVSNRAWHTRIFLCSLCSRQQGPAYPSP